jgi:hypothetical protein
LDIGEGGMRKVSEELGLNNIDYVVNGMSFAEWMDSLNGKILVEYGIGLLDGADFLSYDCWESGGSIEDGMEAWEDAQNL